MSKRKEIMGNEINYTSDYEERKDRLINYISKKGYRVEVWKNIVKTNMLFDTADNNWLVNNIFKWKAYETDYSTTIELA